MPKRSLLIFQSLTSILPMHPVAQASRLCESKHKDETPAPLFGNKRIPWVDGFDSQFFRGILSL